MVAILLVAGANANASNNVRDALPFFLCVSLTIMCITQNGKVPAEMTDDEAVHAAFLQHAAWKRRALVIMIRATRRDVYRMQVVVATAYDLSSAVSNCLCNSHAHAVCADTNKLWLKKLHWRP